MEVILNSNILTYSSVSLLDKISSHAVRPLYRVAMAIQGKDLTIYS
jgi:hypothetical protein